MKTYSCHLLNDLVNKFIHKDQHDYFTSELFDGIGFDVPRVGMFLMTAEELLEIVSELFKDDAEIGVTDLKSFLSLNYKHYINVGK